MHRCGDSAKQLAEQDNATSAWSPQHSLQGQPLGAISTPIRNEGHRICDVIGLESLVDEIANKIVTEQGLSPTSNVILGPFWSPNAPFRALGDSIIRVGYAKPA